MSADQQGLRDALCDSAVFAGVVARYVREESPLRTSDLAAIVGDVHRESILRIGRLAESPIEKMLLTALVMGSTFVNPLGVLVFEPPQGSALDVIKERLENHAWMRALQAKAKGAPEKVDAYIDFLVAEHGVPVEDGQSWKALGSSVAVFGDAFHVIPQAKIPGMAAGGRGIRADALVFVPNRPKFLVAIECDGYEWHSSKSAFDSDRRRDRALKAVGCEVLRFSGSEIYNDPNHAALELYGQLKALAKRSPKPRRWKL